MDKENRPRPRFSIRPSRRDPRRTIRHHNPGTRRPPPTPRVRVLSSITLVPPRDLDIPAGSSAYPVECQPSTSTAFDETTVPPNTDEPPRTSPYRTPWKTPEHMEIPTTNSPWGEHKLKAPAPTVNYEDGFRIFPGKAYQPVPRYINRDIPWELKPIDVPVSRRVKFYRSNTSDPRMHDLRVEVTPLDATPPEPTPPPAPEEHLFQRPQRSQEPSDPTSGPLDHLIRLLDQTYGCPRAAPTPATEPQPSTSRDPPAPPRPPAWENSSITDSLKILLRLARLFDGPRESTEDAYRRYKRPRCARKR